MKQVFLTDTLLSKYRLQIKKPLSLLLSTSLASSPVALLSLDASAAESAKAIAPAASAPRVSDLVKASPMLEGTIRSCFKTVEDPKDAKRTLKVPATCGLKQLENGKRIRVIEFWDDKLAVAVQHYVIVDAIVNQKTGKIIRPAQIEVVKLAGAPRQSKNQFRDDQERRDREITLPSRQTTEVAAEAGVPKWVYLGGAVLAVAAIWKWRTHRAKQRKQEDLRGEIARQTDLRKARTAEKTFLPAAAIDAVGGHPDLKSLKRTVRVSAAGTRWHGQDVPIKGIFRRADLRQMRSRGRAGTVSSFDGDEIVPYYDPGSGQTYWFYIVEDGMLEEAISFGTSVRLFGRSPAVPAVLENGEPNPIVASGRGSVETATAPDYEQMRLGVSEGSVSQVQVVADEVRSSAEMPGALSEIDPQSQRNYSRVASGLPEEPADGRGAASGDVFEQAGPVAANSDGWQAPVTSPAPPPVYEASLAAAVRTEVVAEPVAAPPAPAPAPYEAPPAPAYEAPAPPAEPPAAAATDS